MPLSHPHIEDLKSYTCPDTLLSEKQVSEIEQHLAQCAFCRDLVSEIRQFLKLRPASDDARVRTETEKLLQRIRQGGTKRSRVITLQPRQTRQEIAQPSPRVVLAAATESRQEPTFSVVTTLFSGDDSILLRILLDHEENAYALYVLAEEQSQAAHVLIDSALSDTPVMTDEQGRAAIPVRRELHMETENFRVHQPYASAVLTERDIGQMHTPAGFHVALGNRDCRLRIEDDTLEVWLDASDEEDSLRYVGLALNGHRMVNRIAAEAAVFSAALPTAGTRLLLY